MATEEGVVIKLGSAGIESAWVKTTRTSACKACASRNSCMTKGSGKDMEVEAINSIGARVGDRIVLSIHSASLFKATFLIYIFPILAMLVGAILGHILALERGSQDPSGLSALLAFIFLGVAVIIVKVLGNAMSSKQAYMPTIVRIITRSTEQNDRAQSNAL